MFTGIIEEIGKIRSIKPASRNYKITIICEKLLKKLKVGDSIAVNGICLTVTEFGINYFYADISRETFDRTTMGLAFAGDNVNLETPCTPLSFLSGHIVTGHIDTKAKIIDINSDLSTTGVGPHASLKFQLFQNNRNQFDFFIIEKGSICINGISLTIYNIVDNCFSVAVIPQTYNNTNLKYLSIGSFVNIEFDIIGKYTIKWLEKNNSKNDTTTMDLLKRSGFQTL